ncbi:MAG TPA: four-carbon acid sugar kinase family protein [Bryobacteraceae bacterium]|nr:four-carbon acid sugar kinase family protein [Bryobacteraceae bacterium]
MSILALADDMTGALEVGAKFSAVGVHTVVAAKPLQSTTAQVIVYDTETRHLSPACAAEEVRRFIRVSAAVRPRLLYKKTDSTLRGNISAELRALSELFPDWRVGYAPAYPALGRTVKEGILYVDGVAVSQTSFGNDPLNPVTTSAISAVLGDRLNCTIFDGEHDSHIEDAARAILANESMRIIAGPGALAGAIAGQLVSLRTTVSLPRISSCLLMNGSLHRRSITQMHRAEAPGWTILTTTHAPNAEPARVAGANARRLLDEIESRDPDGVFVIGGDTAFAVIAALGFPMLWPIREIVPGVPITRIRAADIKRNRDLFLITKAGGFGEPDVIHRVHQELNTHVE